MEHVVIIVAGNMLCYSYTYDMILKSSSIIYSLRCQNPAPPKKKIEIMGALLVMFTQLNSTKKILQ